MTAMRLRADARSQVVNDRHGSGVRTADWPLSSYKFEERTAAARPIAAGRALMVRTVGNKVERPGRTLSIGLVLTIADVRRYGAMRRLQVHHFSPSMNKSFRP